LKFFEVLHVFANHQPTPWDLKFRIFGFPVRVHPLCWLGLAMLGQGYFRAGFELGLIWIACSFTSLLWHELGHAFLIRKYGSPASIELHMFGGWAVPNHMPTQAIRRLIIYAAGPAAGFLMCFVAWAILQLVDVAKMPVYLTIVLWILFQINLLWSILNLLPVWPMDGGRILREILVMRGNRYPDLRTHQVSIGVAATLIGTALILMFVSPTVEVGLLRHLPSWLIYIIPGPTMCIFLGLMLFQNYQMMQTLSRPRIHRSDDRVPWER
jgi:stage IV sporulation protein FB